MLDLVDALDEDAIKRSRETPPAEKLRQALELMDAGFRLQRAKLRIRHPNASEEELEARFFAWLCREE
ncbi:MAG: hypothetical protein H6718_10310 [Polyangiaceae bacterium]|nr:hypothetical protein [Myxococcales bacterium]MCB9585784.1 hypothetical protein [Polyangiaceae bacterium]MCB9607287.1 hypothetical protein [Polyangiaceae bacterium]